VSFPQHNDAWREAGEFLAGTVHAGDRVLAPDAFWRIVGRVERYVPANLVGEPAYDWVVLRLDDMPQVPRRFLEGVAERLTPVFANDVFVVWAARAPAARRGTLSRDRLADFFARLARLGPEPAAANEYAEDRALADAPTISRHADLSDRALRDAMNDLFRRTGYRYPTLRDQRFQVDMRVQVATFLRRCAGGTVLDLCSGALPFDELPESTWMLRTDLAEVGVRSGRAADGPRADLAYAVTDAQQAAIRDSSCDGVMFMDSIEHVRDAALVLGEVRRVLVPGGWLLVSFANVDSLHLVMAEKLGYGRFITNHQHIREFSLAEVAALLTGVGLTIRETAGVTLYPYWGVPRIDEVVRDITDDDPEVVEILSELGRRAGAQFAYTGVITAQRTD